MLILAQFLFTTGEGLFLLALLVLAPVAFTLVSVGNVRPIHVAINGVLAVVCIVPAGFAMLFVTQGSGMGGALFFLVGAGAGLLAISFLVATFACYIVLLTKGDDRSASKPGRSANSRRQPSGRPLLEEFASWKATSRRPTATYKEFLEEAHPRYFPASARTLFAAAIAMVVVIFLIARSK